MQPIDQVAIVATLVPEPRRLAFLPRHFDTFAIVLERELYAQLRQLCPAYDGGWWNVDLNNSGCYWSPSGETFEIVTGDGFAGILSADATGVVATLFTLSCFACRLPSREVFAERFHQLRDFALAHADRRLLFAAID